MVTNEKIIIALDGNSSCGKSTFAKLIARELHYSYIDTGAMYRAVTLRAVQKGLFEDTDAPPYARIGTLLKDLDLQVRFNTEQDRTEIWLQGKMVEDQIRSMEVSAHVSYIAAISAVRRKMVDFQRQLGMDKGVVMDGRDIGTVVFPEAELKIFLTASLEVRAERRYKELIQKNMPASKDEVRKNLQKRDHIDSTRNDSPLKKADDAIVLDNSEMTLDQQMQWFKDIYQQVTRTENA